MSVYAMGVFFVPCVHSFDCCFPFWALSAEQRRQIRIVIGWGPQTIEKTVHQPNGARGAGVFAAAISAFGMISPRAARSVASAR